MVGTGRHLALLRHCSGTNCSTIVLCCVTTTWQQIFEYALEIAMVDIDVRRVANRAFVPPWKLGSRT